MNETPQLPPPAKNQSERLGLLVTCATIVILAALGAGGYLLQQELASMANAKPVAPPEVTQALKDLRNQLDQQRSDSASQLQTLQNELAALKEQQAAQAPQDMHEAIAPMQEKLDAIAAQLQEPAKPETSAATTAPVATAEAAPASPATSDMQLALRDYLALRRTVESGAPYARALAVLIPQLSADDMDAVTVLQRHAEQGLGESDEEAEPAASTMKPWMEQVNDKLRGLVSIKPSATPRATPQVRAEVMAALDRIEASLMEAR